jgi:hypothetical protein
MFTTISTYCTFPKTIEQIRQNMTRHVTSRYQSLNSSEVGAKIENLGTTLPNRHGIGCKGASLNISPPLHHLLYLCTIIIILSLMLNPTLIHRIRLLFGATMHPFAFTVSFKSCRGTDFDKNFERKMFLA